jgi:hypothetical protein
VQSIQVEKTLIAFGISLACLSILVPFCCCGGFGLYVWVASDRREQLLVFNNTTTTLTIMADDETARIAPQSSGTVNFPGKSFAIEVLYEPDEGHRYKCVHGSFPNTIVRLQVENDRNLYFLPPTASSIVPGSMPAQPTGYPLKPTDK